MEIRSVAAEPPDLPPPPPEAPSDLIEALQGATELRADLTPEGWQLYGDGVFLGAVSRPASLRLTAFLTPRLSAALSDGSGPSPSAIEAA